MLYEVWSGNLSLSTGLEHIKFDPDNVPLGIPFTPQHQPLIVEWPIYTGQNQTHTWSVTGPPGASYVIRRTKIDDTLWLTPPLFTNLVPTGPTVDYFSGTLPSRPGLELATAVHTLHVPGLAPDAAGAYSIDTYYTPPGSPTVHLGTGTWIAPQLYASDHPFMIYDWGGSPVIGTHDLSRTGGVTTAWMY